MIKKYNQFVKERINENIDEEIEEIDTNQQESELAKRDLEQEFNDIDDEVEEEQPEMEEEGGDIYTSKLQELADKLGVQVEDSKIMYNGKKIIFPSETEMYHVDNKKFKTSDEVVNYLEGGSNEGRIDNREEMERFPHNEVEEPELELQESKSYKYTRKFNRRSK